MTQSVIDTTSSNTGHSHAGYLSKFKTANNMTTNHTKVSYPQKVTIITFVAVKDTINVVVKTLNGNIDSQVTDIPFDNNFDS